jgi:hypothetical protein
MSMFLSAISKGPRHGVVRLTLGNGSIDKKDSLANPFCLLVN